MCKLIHLLKDGWHIDAQFELSMLTACTRQLWNMLAAQTSPVPLVGYHGPDGVHGPHGPPGPPGPRGQRGPPAVSVVNLTEVQYKGQTTKNIQLLHCAAILDEGSLY